MRKLTLTIIFTLLSILYGQHLLFAQTSNHSERRIYLLDATLSMKGFGGAPKIWGDVIEALINQINDVSDPSTELVIVPFQAKVLTIITQKATPSGKKELINRIRAFDYKDVTRTNLYKPILEAKEHIITPDKRNLLFLLTDGKHNDRSPTISEFACEITKWSDFAKINNAYCYYILLTELAKPSDEIKEAIEATDNIDIVPPGPIEFLVVKLPNKKSVNFEEDYDKVIDLTLSSESQIPDGTLIRITTLNNDCMTINQQCEVKNNHIQLNGSLVDDYNELRKKLPKHYSIPLHASLIDNSKAAVSKKLILDTNNCCLDVVNTREKVLKITIADN